MEMRHFSFAVTIVLALLSSSEGQARYCLFPRSAALMKFRVEKFQRQRFATTVNARLEAFLASISEIDRAELREYRKLEPTERLRLLVSLRAHLSSFNKDFQSARCQRGSPEWEDGYVSPKACVGEDEQVVAQPYFHRGLRLFADSALIFVEGSARDRSKAEFVRQVGDFPAGEYFVRVALGDIAEEKACITDAMREFMSGFGGFDDYAGLYSTLPPECLPKAAPSER
ncbi:MAG: hypothetical protein HY075_03725 [Deltaproteobacteria bacterium]|nr:hypothetical protein [Deltaproteobacteria bacterium]